MTEKAAKPTIPEVLPLIKQWYSKEGNSCGGIFHVILSDGNYQQTWADEALEHAKQIGDPDAIQLASLLAIMSGTQRLKLCRQISWDQFSKKAGINEQSRKSQTEQ